MRIALLGRSLSMVWLDELVKFTEEWNFSIVSSSIDLEFIEPTPYVGSYQSRNERSVIWASALKQFYRR